MTARSPDAGRPSPADHEALRGLLGAWALDACLPDETALFEAHLAECGPCADEAARLRDAAGWLSTDEPLDPAPELRSHTLEGCLSRRAPQIRVPGWVAPYSAETAKLDALLRDLGGSEWLEVADVPWYGGSERWRPAEVLCHLAAVDGFVAAALGLDDPVPGPAVATKPLLATAAGDPDGATAPSPSPQSPPPDADGVPRAAVVGRTQRMIALHGRRSPETVRALWREQTRSLIQTAALAGTAGGSQEVDYGTFRLPARDAFVDRAFECWIHADNVARAVDYPYDPPSPQHLRQMIDLAARMLPTALEGLRQAGLSEPVDGARAAPPAPAAPVRVLKLVIEGPVFGEWLIPLDGSTAAPADTAPVASLVVDGLEFCYLAAAHRDPDRMPVGQHGDPSAVHDVLHATPLLSRP